jgi:hypothetical protein
MFQIVDSQSKMIEAAFTLVLPPQQMSVKEKQRVTITKTFGNAFIDDYGPDNKEITIRGISGTSSVFPTYSPSGVSSGTGTEFQTWKTMQETLGSPASGGTGYNGRSAFYTFRDTIMRYKEKFTADYDKKELHVYDLYDEQAYKCVLLDFTLDRSADKPFYYTYSISLFVYEDLMGKNAFKPTPIPVGGNITSIFDNLDGLLQWTKDFAAPFRQLSSSLALIENTLKLIKGRWDTSLSDLRFVIESPLKLTQQMLQLCLDVGKLVGDAYEEGRMVVQDYTSFIETIQGMVSNTLHMYGIAISTQSTQSNTIAVSEDKGIATSEESAGPNDRSSETNTFTYYGYIIRTLSAGDTLQGLALTYLGDPSLWVFIASINGIQGNEDLTSMETIYIPIPVEAGSAKDLFVLSEDPKRDPFGADIRIDSNGNIIISEGGDLALVYGLTNLVQAINIRMQTSPGSLIRQTAYGLLSTPGDAGTEAALSYVRTAFRSSLIADTRIRNATNIQVVFSGGSVFLSADIEVIGMDKTIPVSVKI